ncbi:hypothetical protein DIZ81_11515 [Legionella taurinensis]|uniref:Uncharacterized protein n=1 Tax=Legionella taurinensis TaxID=70611 RepID=A0AB38N2F9_9GAMM|nr:hypothetical protein [Legionella taurinensis]PUT39029.1 hypothetical protein DB744_11525 [Legionella taurinensis]PUT41116.1 hypothetical protein DB746_09915 [Legionella taurinensis]PUT43491.1 hypothetical protein DB743_10920 [Legionella taurinensis]PUT46508.1 hypothetical protein DB745_10405 [Legionella taurinensis]TID32118.1 hypothetical protein DIZ41_10920 [Legionella taurinensis]
MHAPETNIKAGVTKLFIHDETHIAAIASYHNDPDYIKRYIEVILNTPLTLRERIDTYADNVLSVYNIQSMPMPLIISTVKGDEFNARVARLKVTGKNAQIGQVLQYLETVEKIPLAEAVEVEFYDDDEKNYREACEMTRHFSFTAFYIDRQNQAELVIKESKRAGLLCAPQLEPAVEDEVIAGDIDEIKSPSLSG